MTQLPELTPILPELTVICLAMILLIYGAFRGDGATRNISWIAVLGLIVAGVAVSSIPAGRVLAFGGQFVIDDFGRYMKWLVLLGSGLSIIMSMSYNERESIAKPEFPVFILFATLGMMMMISANGLISLYVGLELQSLSLYVIAAFHRDSVRSSEAGLKYFVLGALSSGMLLYGSSLVYGFSGTTNFTVLADLFKQPATYPSIGFVVGMVFVLAGLAFKISAVPFHMWTPDVYEGAPTPVTAFFAVAPKIAALALFVRVLIGPFGELFDQWQQVVVLMAVLSMLVGAFAAIWQTNIKRLMAYSSIGHVGYALIGVAAGSEGGIKGVMLYMTIYLVMNIGTFCCILSMRRDGRMVENINDLAGLSRTRPMLALALAVFMFSMAGIPPLAGFFGKLYIFLAAVDAELYTLAIIGVLTSVVGAFYYLRIVKLMYFDEPAEAFDKDRNREIGILTAAAALLISFFIIFAGPVIEGAEAAVGILFKG